MAMLQGSTSLHLHSLSPPLQSFLQSLHKNSSLFTIGEYANPKVSYISSRLTSGALASSLNFPLQDAISTVFVAGGDMSTLSELMALSKQMLTQHMDVMGNFADK